MTTEVKSTVNGNSGNMDNVKVQIKKILLPIDGSDCSFYAAKHAVPRMVQKRADG
jgi:hypothetical protein